MWSIDIVSSYSASMDAEIRRRLRWVELFLRLENYSVVCLKCGISRPTLRKWVRRYQQQK